MQVQISKNSSRTSTLLLNESEYKQLKWISSDEVIINDVVCDVVSVQKKGTEGFTIKVINDKDETDVLKCLEEGRKDNNAAKKTLSVLFSLINHNSSKSEFLNFDEHFSDNIVYSYLNNYNSLSLEQDSPPPKLI